jgi:hypothetical protein
MNQIVPYDLWVGHAGDARGFKELFDLGIQAVVQIAAEEAPLQPPRDLIVCRFPLDDGSGNRPEIVGLAARCVATLVKSDTPTLVCCGAGMSRSPAIAAAALYLLRHGSLEECLLAVTRLHPADVSPAFWKDVRSVMARSLEEP